MEPLPDDPLDEIRTVPVRRGSKTPVPSPQPPVSQEGASVAAPAAPLPNAGVDPTSSLPEVGLPPVADASADDAPEARTIPQRRGNFSSSASSPPVMAHPPIDCAEVEARTLSLRPTKPPPAEVRRHEPESVSLDDLPIDRAIDPARLRAELQAELEEDLFAAPPEAITTPLHRNPLESPTDVDLPKAGSHEMAAEATPENTTSARDLCPRCQTKLIRPQNLGMCPRCGYCRTLEEDQARVSQLAAPRSRWFLLGMAELYELWRRLPSWALVLVHGFAVVLALSLLAAGLFSAMSPARAYWSAIQTGLGVILLGCGHVLALLAAATHDARFGVKDLVLSPLWMWNVALRQLPETRWSVWLVAWGSEAIFLAVFLIGGWSLWFHGQTEHNPIYQDIQRATDHVSERFANSELQHAVTHLDQNKQDALRSAAARDLRQRPKAPPAYQPSPEKDDRPATQCAVIGYVPPEEPDSPMGLLLAAVREGEMRYVGIVWQKLWHGEEATQQFTLADTPGPSTGDGLPAVWVKPTTFVEVKSSGFDDNGTLKEPNFAGVLNTTPKK